MPTVKRISAVLLTLVVFSRASAGEPACQVRSVDVVPPASDGCCTSCEDFAARTRQACDWFGVRSGLEERGIKLAGRSTHFAFGVVDGINVAAPPPPFGRGDAFSYTGRGEYDAVFDLEKFGGLPHGSLLVRAEHWYGEYGNVSLRTGSFSPPVFPAALPPAREDKGDLFLTNFIFTQPLSEKFVVFAGKKDVLGAADQDVFAGGDGTEQFVNQALIANPAFLLGLPYTGFVTGVALPRDWGMITAIAYDPKDRTQDFFDLGDLYSQGVIAGCEIKVNTNVIGRPGELHAGGFWKHVDLTDLRFSEPPPGVYPEPTVPGFPTLPDSWTIYTGFDQYLRLYADAPRKGWGLFGRMSLSDGNPTPIRYFLSAGIGGDSALRADKSDKWGIGWYYVGASDQFGAIPQFVFGPRDGTGVELFYNFQLTRFLNVTPDIQFIRPEASALADKAFVYGLRANLSW